MFLYLELNNESNNIIQKINKLKNSNVEDHIKGDLNNLLDKENINGKVYTRIKDIEKAIEKMSRKGYTDVSQMTDLVGGKIVASNIGDVYKLKEYLTQQYNSFEINDFIKNPLNSGYRSLHLDLNIKDQRVEVQIKTLQMDKAQSITHDTLYKNSPDIQELKMPTINLSREIYAYYADKENYFETTDINKISKNPLINYIEKENSKALENNDRLEKQRSLLDIQEDKFNKAKIYLNNIDKYSTVDKAGIIDRFFGRDKNNKNSENLKMYKEKLESLGIKDGADYEKQYKEFNKLKDEMN